MFAKAHKDGRYYFGNKVVQVDKEQVGSKEIGDIVCAKWREVLDKEEMEKLVEIGGIGEDIGS